MKKLSLTSILMVCMSIAAIAVYAATTKIMVATSPGARAVNTIGIGKPVHIEAIGCLPASGTVVVHRITGNSTNQDCLRPAIRRKIQRGHCWHKLCCSGRHLALRRHIHQRNSARDLRC